MQRKKTAQGRKKISRMHDGAAFDFVGYESLAGPGQDWGVRIHCMVNARIDKR